MLRIAVPNKGSLSEPAASMLREAGYRQRRDTEELVVADPDNDVEFFFLRPRDIAIYVGSGTLDVGITGRDLLLDSGAPAEEILPLGFGRVDLPVRRPGPATAPRVADLAGQRVATRYPGLVEQYLAEHGVDGRRWCGWTARSRPPSRLGVADVIADVVETGTTLRSAGLEMFGEPILRVRGRAHPPRAARADDRPVEAAACAACRASSSPAST